MEPGQGHVVQGFYYQVEDTIRIAYADFDWVSRISRESYWRVAAQYSDQRSEGANLLTGSAFKGWNAGLYGEYGWTWLRLYAAASSTGTGQAMRSPYSFSPFYIGRRIKTFNRAGEDALLAGATFDLAGFGLPGFSIDLNVADGRHARRPHGRYPHRRQLGGELQLMIAA
ncbi:MAG: OprD family outer membrane porin [Burkholderiales bacterium]